MKLTKSIREPLEGHDGKLSSRKLTTFSGMLMLIITWFFDLFYDLTISELMLMIIGIVVLIGAGYMTAQNIVSILKRPDPNYYSDDIYQVGRRAGDDNTDTNPEG
jgi:hypothetical protein